MLRRQLFAGAAGAAMGSAFPRFAVAQRSNARTLKFIAQADLAVVDPIITTAYVSRNHAYMVWDTLYGMDENFKPQPQMVEGHVVEEGGKRVTMTLRPGMKFHDGEPVRASDAVASIRRWAARDALGQVLFSVLDDLSAADDKTIVFRLKRPFPLLFEALAKPATPVCFIMPERLAQTDPATAVKEVVGSGPFRFRQDQRVPGSLVVYEKFADYVPRTEGSPSWTAGPKHVHFDRVEWHVMPDAATAAASLQNGEMDWWEQPTGDLQPVLRRSRDIVLEIPDPTGLVGMARFNHLHPPFNNPAIRRALLGAVSQEDFMTSVIGTDRTLWREGVGVFPPETPLASNAGMEVLTSPRDFDKVKRDLAAAGYKGEKVVLIAASDFPSLNALAQVGNDMLQKCGMNVEFVSTDWGSVVQRRASREPVEKGGWSMFFTFWAGLDMVNPGVQQALRGHGQAAWFGWPTAPKLEELRNAWFEAPDLAAQKEIGRQIQLQALQDVPYLPVGQYFQATAYRRDLVGVPKGLPLFWNVKRA
ncbi:ABC transporter substrate-binding protein [Pseudoroseomonas wenyumeiae]|uniref:ABC transporter substrate-binding protein n=1 Tax=Teichococcus wenyumeiae TaxID=2478470 RepID=A0A3A9JX12_9PROT|nr:ABC transporter substrate-binding protein [Pseudoroseomonas wenyumeiae]RKK05338.1 ABC transporter substrate-binding protein [Pseudoroseomonas wenyumeiae]RMI25541.1 ABC transporter substrate-binding protein [Pseudoroseomonas wenyumeiae]